MASVVGVVVAVVLACAGFGGPSGPEVCTPVYLIQSASPGLPYVLPGHES